jgi:hypothetical protein
MSARLTAYDRQMRSITEATWQVNIITRAHLNGWRIHHPPKAGVRSDGSVRTTRHTTPGYPDLTLVRGDRLVFIEVKRETGKATPEQLAWLDLLHAAGAEVHLWKPSDLPTVMEVLK